MRWGVDSALGLLDVSVNGELHGFINEIDTSLDANSVVKGKEEGSKPMVHRGGNV